MCSSFILHDGETSKLRLCANILQRGHARFVTLGLALCWQAIKNDEGVVVNLGTCSDCTETFYCGRYLGRDAIPGPDAKFHRSS